MKNKEQFERSVNVLVEAYKKNTLVHSSACACAVGNLVANAYGTEIIPGDSVIWGIPLMKWENGHISRWYDALAEYRDNEYTPEELEHPDLHWMKKIIEKGGAEIAATGYTMAEIDAIEAAFEFRSSEMTDTEQSEFPIYNRLVAVYDTLCTIHEVEVASKVEAALVFVKD